VIPADPGGTDDGRRAYKDFDDRLRAFDGAGGGGGDIVTAESMRQSGFDGVLGAERQHARHHRVRDVEREIARHQEYQPRQHGVLIVPDGAGSLEPPPRAPGDAT
jgi:hypothetical protein